MRRVLSSKPDRRRILVVEDDRKTAASLRLYLEHAGFEVSTALTGSEALRQARETEPDLLLLDVMLPEVDGLAVCRALRAERDVPVILVTARSTEEDKLEGLALGADDYVTKPFSPREVVARVRAVLRRARHPEMAQGRIRTQQVEIDVGAHTAAVRGRPVELTPAEFDLLAALARAPGRAFSRAGLVERAFGADYDGLERTLDAHVMRLRRKIESPGQPPLLVTVFGVGYRLDDRPS
jgi:DNA-binding response OmpR family regulator